MTDDPNHQAERETEEAFGRLLRSLGADGGLDDAAKRAAELWHNQLLGGTKTDIAQLFASKMRTEANGPVIMTGVGMHLVCPHHLTVAFGDAHLAYIPKGHVASLGALSDLVAACTRRLVLQEDATQQIARALVEHLGASAAVATLDAQHPCHNLTRPRSHAARVATWARAGDSTQVGPLQTSLSEAIVGAQPGLTDVPSVGSDSRNYGGKTMTDRPFVYANMAMTADGKIASAKRQYPAFTSDYDRQNMDKLRAEADALLVGAGTLRDDNPQLHVRHAKMRAYREQLGKPAGLTYVTVSKSLTIPQNSHFLADGHARERIVATVDNAPSDRVKALSHAAHIWQTGTEHVDVRSLVRRLREHGIERLLVEGGAELNWSFLAAGLLDEINITIAPALLGGRAAPSMIAGPGLPQEAQQRLRLLSVQQQGDELFCRYAIVR